MREGVQLKLCNPWTTRAKRQCFCGGLAVESAVTYPRGRSFTLSRLRVLFSENDRVVSVQVA